MPRSRSWAGVGALGGPGSGSKGLGPKERWKCCDPPPHFCQNEDPPGFHGPAFYSGGVAAASRRALRAVPDCPEPRHAAAAGTGDRGREEGKRALRLSRDVRGRVHVGVRAKCPVPERLPASADTKAPDPKQGLTTPDWVGGEGQGRGRRAPIPALRSSGLSGGFSGLPSPRLRLFAFRTGTTFTIPLWDLSAESDLSPN
ncbi:hypothetical protein H8959_001822 [Pygathrix nigripes]